MVSLELADLEEGHLTTGIAKMSRVLFYPKQWSTEHAHKRPIMRHMIDCEGVTEVDVRDMRYVESHDVVMVRLWNYRKFFITGEHMMSHG